VSKFTQLFRCNCFISGGKTASVTVSLSQDYKLKHMAEMQQSVVGDSDARQQIANQVIQWEENLERLHCEQFRLRCYMASLQSGELPNPKVKEDKAGRGAPVARRRLTSFGWKRMSGVDGFAN
jgi:hypothetical protein